MKGLRSIGFMYLFLCLLVLNACGGRGSSMPETMVATDVNNWGKPPVSKESQKQIGLAIKALDDPQASLATREHALYVLATRENPQINIAQEVLLTRYVAENLEEQVEMENLLYSELTKLPEVELKSLVRQISPSTEGRYPYSLIMYAAAKRKLFPRSDAVANRLLKSGLFKSPQIVGINEIIPVAPRKGCMSLLLPQHGDIAPISQQIITGAEAAREVLLAEGIDWDVYYIDTQEELWMTKFVNLPASCITVGGPLQQHIYRELEDDNAFSKRVVFPFLPSLNEPDDEGEDVWRFFTSPEDQIYAMVTLASMDFDITSFGVFSPQTAYGIRMEKTFIKIAEDQGFTVTTATYPIDNVRAWSPEIQNFLKSSPPEGNQKLPTLEADFGAIFLSDSWRNIDMIVSSMRYHGGHKKLILGTSLWEQTLNQPTALDEGIYRLTMFPIAYDSMQFSRYATVFHDAMMTQNVVTSDWVVLGFDFVLMASQLGLDTRLPSDEINARLAALRVDYVGAPFEWNEDGKLSRILAINQPSRSQGRIPYVKEAVLSHYLYEEIVPEEPEETEAEKLQKEYDSLNDLVNRINPPSRIVSQ